MYAEIYIKYAGNTEILSMIQLLASNKDSKITLYVLLLISFEF